MMNTLLRGTIASLLISNFAEAAGRNRVSGTTSDEWDRGTFQNPSINARPKFRYWAPDAFLDDSRIDYDVQQLQKIGMGGFELICFQLYGDPTPSVYGVEIVDWGEYGFGSAAWKEKTGVYATAARKYGLNMDFAMGPNQGAGVPVENPDSPGLSTGLEYGHTTITAGQTYSAAAPLPDLGYQPTFNEYWMWPATQASPATLVGASAGRVSRVSGGKIYLDEDSMVDLTSQINNGSLTFTAPGNGTDQWYIFSFWQRRTGQYAAREGLHGRNADPPASYGSYIVDHFSATGAKLSTDFLDQYAIPPGDFEEVSMYAWEDSVETVTSLYWTDTMFKDFTDRRGYSPIKSLPLFYTTYSARTFYFDKSDSGRSYTTDYYQTLTEKYIEYMTHFKEWAHSKGFQYSHQPAYNLPLDVPAAVPYTDAPECESLGFSNSIDAYRQFAGAVNVANARIMSNENGARGQRLYSYTWPDLLNDIRLSWAGGVNQLVMHGSPYSGNYPNTTWPGYTAFIWEGYSGSHNSRQPAWEMYPDVINHISRTHWALQAGVPKIDLAMYRYSFATQILPIWADNSLWNEGYTWNYLSPANLDLPSVTVQDGALAKNGPEYKAFLIDNQKTLTVGGAQHLAEYADAGLPIIFIGSIPSSTPGNNATGAAYVNSTVQSILSKKNVVTVATEADVTGALSKLGIQPFCGSSFVCVHRFDEAEDTHYVFFFNPHARSSQNVTLQTTGTPFLMDTWSGDVERIGSYFETSSSISFPLTIAANSTVLIAISPSNKFSSQGSSAQGHALPSSSFDGNVSYSGPSLIAKSFTSQDATLSLSNSDSPVPIQISVTQPRQTLNTWQVTIEEWGPLEDIYDATNHSTTYHTYNISSLTSWDVIDPALKHVSGIGHYKTTFPWNGTATDGAILTTGLVFHTQSATLNGQPLNAFELWDPWVDISAHLKLGDNVLEFKVASTLQNCLLGLPFNIETSAGYANPPYPQKVGQEQRYGLVGPVVVIPYGTARVPVS